MVPPTDEALFAAALERESSSERQALLDEACRDDPARRRRVERLLAAHERSSGILEREAGDFLLGGPPSSAMGESAGTVIGPYKLKELIGEGGFGLVYVAEQQAPVRRKVALKIIKPGMDSREVVARFETERQALAMMDHPHIARVLDAGSTDSGRPFFVMELVRGVAITEYCDKNRLTTAERLRLFVAVCQAVQHAHGKGVIHRDLKPSNVLVTLHDGVPVVKVIDFGVAKALNQRLTERSVYTRFAEMIGTPLYMSPEQAEMSGLDVDTRADIYSLGVLLYELLTGTTPFEGERLKAAGFDELRRILREEDPPRPSMRISTLAQRATTVSANRRTDPRQLSRLFRGELDWIVMRALEKDRNRRYETAAAFAQDVQRYLRDEPVEASPPSTAYRVRKFLRRHRGAAAAAAVIFVLLAGGVAGTGSAWLEARQAWAGEAARAEAETRERRRAETAERDARQKAKEARETADVANAMLNFLRKDLLGQAGSAAQAGRRFAPNPNLTVREALDRAAADVGNRFPGQPELEAAVRNSLGDAYRQLGQYEKALPQLRRAAELWTKVRGPEHNTTLVARLALAGAYRETGQLSDAIRLFEELRDDELKCLGPEHATTLSTLHNLAVAYRDAGRSADALALNERVREARVRTLGPEDPETLVTLHNLASLYLDAGQTAVAIARFEEVREAKVRVLGPDHPDVLPTLVNLATAYWKMKRYDRSIPLLEEAVRSSKKQLGEDHPETLRAMANLGVNYRDAGRLEEAAALLRRVQEEGGGLPALAWVRSELLIAYVRAGRTTETMGLVKENLAAARKADPGGGLRLGSALASNGLTLLQVHAWAEAEPVLREALRIREREAPDDWRTFDTRSMLGEALTGLKRYDEARSELVAGFEGMKKRTGAIPPNSRSRLTQALDRLIRYGEATNRAAEVEQWRAERVRLEAELSGSQGVKEP